MGLDGPDGIILPLELNNCLALNQVPVTFNVRSADSERSPHRAGRECLWGPPPLI